MLPQKVRDVVRGLLARRVRRIVDALASGVHDSTLAELAWLIGEAGAMLDPFAVSSLDVVRRENEARRHARVCVWDGECEADATTDDGLCAAHAEEQRREEAETSALIERGEIAGGGAG